MQYNRGSNFWDFWTSHTFSVLPVMTMLGVFWGLASFQQKFLLQGTGVTWKVTIHVFMCGCPTKPSIYENMLRKADFLRHHLLHSQTCVILWSLAVLQSPTTPKINPGTQGLPRSLPLNDSAWPGASSSHGPRRRLVCPPASFAISVVRMCCQRPQVITAWQLALLVLPMSSF